MQKWLAFLLIVFILFGCKKEFTPNGALGGTNKYLVVDGIINAGTDSTFIKLSTTKKFDTVIVADPVTGAKLIVESDANSSYPLIEIRPGTYAAAPLNLDAAHKYRLRIKTSDNREYLSDLVAVKNAPPIDSIGFKALGDGLHIYVNSHNAANNTRYYRWDFDETWQFHANLFSTYTAPGKYNCFGNHVSNTINIANTAKLSSDVVYQAPITTIPSSSEKIEVKYSILVRQYALSGDAYNFWENLQKNSSNLGSIFDAQPSLNQTNYHNTADPNEPVIGYLSVGSYSSKRIFISAAQLPAGYKANNGLSCPIDTAYYFHEPYYYPNPPYASVDISGKYPGYIGLERSYITPQGPFGAPNFITYTRTECADCTLRGNQVQPSFWK